MSLGDAYEYELVTGKSIFPVADSEERTPPPPPPPPVFEYPMKME